MSLPTTPVNKVIAVTTTPLAPRKATATIKLLKVLKSYEPLKLSLTAYQTSNNKIVYRLVSQPLNYKMTISKEEGTKEFYRLTKLHSMVGEQLKQSSEQLTISLKTNQDLSNELTSLELTLMTRDQRILSMTKSLETLRTYSAQVPNLQKQNNDLLTSLGTSNSKLNGLLTENKELKRLLKNTRIALTKQRSIKDCAIATLKATNNQVRSLIQLVELSF